jgi:hypothetical protein
VQAGSASVKAGGKHAAAVQDQQVAGAKQTGKISKSTVFKIAGRAQEMQQAGAAAIREGFLRDQLSRKVKVKV